MKSQFKTGNVVKLASGGPKMTVVGTSNETDEVVVQYFNDKAEMQVSTVNPEALNSLDEVAYDGKKYYVQRFANLSEYREEPGFYELKVKCGQSGFGFLAGILGEWAAKTADLSVGSTVKIEGEWIIATAYKSFTS